MLGEEKLKVIFNLIGWELEVFYWLFNGKINKEIV